MGEVESLSIVYRTLKQNRLERGTVAAQGWSWQEWCSA